MHMPQTDSFSRLKKYLPALLVSLAALLLYILTAAPGTSLREANYDLTVAAADLGCAHSPGYPLHSLTAHLATALSPDNPALATNIFSGLFGALAVFLFALALVELGRLIAPKKSEPSSRERWLAALAALVFGVTATFWEQASLTEVYTQHLVLLAAMLLVLFRVRRLALADQPVGRELVLAGLLSGLLLVSHNATLTYLPALVLIALPALRKLNLRTSLLTIAAFLVGLSVYLYLPLRASTGPLINWEGTDTWRGFIDGITQSAYAKPPLERSFAQLLTQLAWVGRTFWREFVIGGLLLTIPGFALLGKKGQRGLLVGLLLLLLLPTAGVVLVRNSPPFELLQSDEAFLLSGVLVLVMGLFLGASWLSRKLNGKWSRSWVLGGLGIIAAATLLTSFPRVDLSSEEGMEQFGQDLFADAPPNALLVTSVITSDGDYFDALVRRYLLDQRPDIEITAYHTIHNDWYQRELTDRAGLIAPSAAEIEQLQSIANAAPDEAQRAGYLLTGLLMSYSRINNRPLAVAVSEMLFQNRVLAGRPDRGEFIPLGMLEVWRPVAGMFNSRAPQLGEMTLARFRPETLRYQPDATSPLKYDLDALEFLTGRFRTNADANGFAANWTRAVSLAMRPAVYSPRVPELWRLPRALREHQAEVFGGTSPGGMELAGAFSFGLYDRAANIARLHLTDGTAGIDDFRALMAYSLIMGDEKGAEQWRQTLELLRGGF